MNKLEEIRKISAELKEKGIFAIDFIAVEYANNQEQFEKIVNAYYNSPKEQPIKEFIKTLILKNKFKIYHSDDFGKSWELYSETTTHDILELMEEDCKILGDDYLYDDDLRIVYNSYGEVFAYLNENENENDLKNKRVVE